MKWGGIRRHDFVGSQVKSPVKSSADNKNRFPMAMGGKKSHLWLLSGLEMISVRWPG